MAESTNTGLRVAVLGAAGTIAPAIVHDLGVSEEVSSLHLLDLRAEHAAEVARDHGGGKASVRALDARDHDAMTALLGDVDVLLNTASYRVNLDAMRACLSSGTTYLDLGGLYWITAQQLELHEEFQRAGVLAILGLGSSPGKTNLMARHAVDALGEQAGVIEEIEVMAGGRDPAAPADGRLRPPYAIQTLLDELTLAPVVLQNGRPVEIEPLSPGGRVNYGEPIGEAETIFTLHSELSTFGRSFGCRQASFRLSLAPPLLAALRELTTASPEEVAQASQSAASPSNETVSVHIVRVRSAPGGVVGVRCVTRPHFGLGGSVVSTAAPAAAAVRLLARGQLDAVGALPPEDCIEPELMFTELRSRGCEFSVARSG